MDSHFIRRFLVAGGMMSGALIPGHENGGSAESDDFSVLKRAVLGKDRAHRYLRELNNGNSFKLMRGFDDMIAEVRSLEELSNVLETAPEEALIFHTMGGENDFARWIKDVIGHEELGETLAGIEPDNPEEFRWKMVSALYNEILSIKLCQLYSDDV